MYTLIKQRAIGIELNIIISGILNINIMYSTWVDNDHNNTDAFRRIDSASKKAPGNRIQV